MDRSIAGTAEFKKFVAKLDSQTPTELDVHLICANYATHKAPAIAKWLDAHPRFHMHQALEKDIRDWIAAWNDNPRPFTWTKTADEILENLISCIQRIPGAAH